MLVYRSVSVRRLHAVTPGAVLSCSDVLVPVVSQGTHVAELALNALALDERVTSDNARLPLALALRTGATGLVQVVVVALFASAHGQGLTNIAVHVDLQDPITDLVTILRTQEVFLWQSNIVG